MEEYKQKEIEYYDNKAVKYQAERKGDFEGFNPKSLSSLRFCYNWFEKNCQDKKFLDYGCGNGIHSMFPAECGAEVTGIDLSEKSLEIARKRTNNKIPFLLMDCEKMNFQDNSFDIVFNGGAFSSLDLNKVFPEVARILKTKGHFIGIETLGHNFFSNLNRKINKAKGKRTEWEVSHIFKIDDIAKAKMYFNKTEVYFFHLMSWIFFPVLRFPFGKYLLNVVESIDGLFLKLPFMKKYAFKIVFIFSEPK